MTYFRISSIFQDLKRRLDEDKPNKQHAKATSDKILRFPNDNVEKKPVNEHCDKVLKKREEIERSVDGKIATLEKQISKAKKFCMGVATVDTWAPQIDDALEQDQVAAKEPEEIKQQLKKLDVSFYGFLTRSLYHVTFYRDLALQFYAKTLPLSTKIKSISYQQTNIYFS